MPQNDLELASQASCNHIDVYEPHASFTLATYIDGNNQRIWVRTVNVWFVVQSPPAHTPCSPSAVGNLGNLQRYVDGNWVSASATWTVNDYESQEMGVTKIGSIWVSTFSDSATTMQMSVDYIVSNGLTPDYSPSEDQMVCNCCVYSPQTTNATVTYP